MTTMLLPQQPSQAKSSEHTPVREPLSATPVSLALPNRVELERALHPLIPPTSSGKQDVVLVVDESPSMVIWQERIVAWEALLKGSGAFCKVQTWGFMGDSDSNQVQLYLGIGTNADRSQTHEPHELLEPSGQRLILVISDCVSPVWYQKPIIEMLQCWGENHPVAIVQMLPERLWSRTALGDAVRVDLRAQDAGSPNTQLEIDSISRRFDKQNDEQKRSDELPMPVITLEARTLEPWAKSLAGCKLWIAGVLFSKSAFDEPPPSAQEGATESTISAAQRFQRFKATTSPTARQLAGYLAAVPLTWPIMRIVQQEMLPDSTLDHLAEVLLSGLIEQKTAYHPTIEADDLRHDFVEDVRDLLLSTTLISETVEVLALVFKKVYKFYDTKTGQAPDFYTLIADPEAVDQLYFEKGDRQVAIIAINVLRRLGGKYAKLATKLEEWISQLEMIEKVNSKALFRLLWQAFNNEDKETENALYKHYKKRMFDWIDNNSARYALTEEDIEDISNNAVHVYFYDIREDVLKGDVYLSKALFERYAKNAMEDFILKKEYLDQSLNKKNRVFPTPGGTFSKNMYSLGGWSNFLEPINKTKIRSPHENWRNLILGSEELFEKKTEKLKQQKEKRKTDV